MVDWLTPEWPAFESIRAVCTTRTGGISGPPYDEFNLATHVNDQADLVTTNRLKLDEDLALPSSPVWLDQIHSQVVVELDSAHAVSGSIGGPLEADGCFTRDQGVVLAILVADCLPILLASPQTREIAALHAGWKGLAGNIIKNGVELFTGQDLVAWIGPSIGQCHYEVDVTLRDLFPGDFLREGRDKDHWMLDLQGIASQQLKDLGVEHIYQANACTYCQSDKFYSFRRDGATGRFAVLIWMDELT